MVCMAAATHGCFRLPGAAAFFAVLTAAACGCFIFSAIFAARDGGLVVLHAGLAVLTAARRSFLPSAAVFSFCVFAMTHAHLSVFRVGRSHFVAAGTFGFFRALLLVGRYGLS
jgi:hypothetical protein